MKYVTPNVYETREVVFTERAKNKSDQTLLDSLLYNGETYFQHQDKIFSHEERDFHS